MRKARWRKAAKERRAGGGAAPPELMSFIGKLSILKCRAACFGGLMAAWQCGVHSAAAQSTLLQSHTCRSVIARPAQHAEAISRRIACRARLLRRLRLLAMT